MQTILDGARPPASPDAADPIYQTPALADDRGQPAAERRCRRWSGTSPAGTQVYRVQVVGYFDGGGPAARVEAVIDTNGGRPRIVYWRDLTELGRGFDLHDAQPVSRPRR